MDAMAANADDYLLDTNETILILSALFSVLASIAMLTNSF